MNRCVDSSVGLNDAIAHHDVAARVGRDVRFVRHHDDGDAAVVQLLENSHDFDAGAAVEISGRLVGQQHFRIVDQGARDRDALLLAAGKLTRMMIFAAGQADRLKNLVGPLPQLGVASIGACRKATATRHFPARTCAAARLKLWKTKPSLLLRISAS